VIIFIISIIYYHIHIYRKSWLTNSLSLLVILNLVSEPSIVETLFSFSRFATDLLFAFSTWILLLPPTSPSPPVVQHGRPAIYKLLPVVSFLHNSNLHLQSMSLIPPHKFLSFLHILWEHILRLSFLCQTPTKLFRWNLRTQIISIGECRWSPIFLVKMFFTSLTARCCVLHLINSLGL